jgi:hypothetical protein
VAAGPVEEGWPKRPVEHLHAWSPLFGEQEGPQVRVRRERWIGPFLFQQRVPALVDEELEAVADR